MTSHLLLLPSEFYFRAPTRSDHLCPWLRGGLPRLYALTGEWGSSSPRFSPFCQVLQNVLLPLPASFVKLAPLWGLPHWYHPHCTKSIGVLWSSKQYLLVSVIFKKVLFIYSFFREKGREGDRQGEKQSCVRSVASHRPPTGHLAPNWAPGPQPGTWPSTQARALTGNGTSNILVPRLVLSPLSHTYQDYLSFEFKEYFSILTLDSKVIISILLLIFSDSFMCLGHCIGYVACFSPAFSS